MAEAVLAAAATFVDDSVDLKALDDSKLKKEFLELTAFAMTHELNSLQKARMEYLSEAMGEQYRKQLQREEIQRQKKEQLDVRQRKERERKLLRKRTKRGQPVLGNLAKIQLDHIKRSVAADSKK